MIGSLEINYKEKIHRNFEYIKNGNKLMLPKKTIFNDNLNIIIGENGCGKSTMMKILSALTLSTGGFSSLNNQYTFWEDLSIFYPKIHSFRDDKYSEINKCFSIKFDYDSPVKCMRNIKNYDNEEILSNINNFSNYLNSKSLSNGELMLYNLNLTINDFIEKSKNYSRDNLFANKQYVNELWLEAYNKLNEYIQNTNSIFDKKIGTILMDEPDNGLDVVNLLALKNWLLSIKNVQIIAIIHNPILIKSLAENGANVIELSKNYLKKIKTF